jgi:tetratricopeptide (TPR) repeat protein
MKSYIASRRYLVATGILIAASTFFAIGSVQAEFQPGNQRGERMVQKVELMNTFLGLVVTVHDISSDPDKAAILQIQQLEDLYKARGDTQGYVQALNQVLDNAKSPAVRNVAYLKLHEIYKNNGNIDKAIATVKEGLKENIKRGK